MVPMLTLSAPTSPAIFDTSPVIRSRPTRTRAKSTEIPAWPLALLLAKTRISPVI